MQKRYFSVYKIEFHQYEMYSIQKSIKICIYTVLQFIQIGFTCMDTCMPIALALMPSK